MVFESTGHTGAMIALAVPNPETYAIDPPTEDSTPADELHITLAYMGEAADILPEQRAEILDAVGTLAQTSSAPEALFPATSGVFPPDPESTEEIAKAPYYTAPANPERFNDLREDLLVHMGSRGVGDLVSRKHPVFTPHVTLAYAPLDSPPALDHLPTPLPTTFSKIIVKFGDEIHEFDLATPEQGPELPLTASVRSNLSTLANKHNLSEEYLTALYLRQRQVRSTPACTRASAALDAVVASIDPEYFPDSYSRVKELTQRLEIEPDPAARVFIAARALALTERTPVSTTTQDARERSALVASLQAIIADGNSSAARSLRARSQLRDRYGRWIEQGGGVRFKIRVPGAPGGGTWYHGTVKGFDIPNKRVLVELEDGRVVKIPNDKIEQPKAILGMKIGEKLKKFVPKSRDRVTDATSPKHKAKLDNTAAQDALDDAAVEAMDRLKEQMQPFASSPVTGGHITRFADGQDMRERVSSAEDAGEENISVAGTVAPFKEQPATSSVADLKAVQAALDGRIKSALPEDYADLDPEAQKKALSKARGLAIAGLGGLSNDSKDKDAKELRKAPSVGTDKDLEEVAPEEAAPEPEKFEHSEVLDATKDALAELKDRVSEDSPLAKPLGRIEQTLTDANSRFENGEDEYDTYLKNLDKIKEFANKQESFGTKGNPEAEAFSSFAEDIDDIHTAIGGTDEFGDVDEAVFDVETLITKEADKETDAGPLGMTEDLQLLQSEVDSIQDKLKKGDYIEDAEALNKDLTKLRTDADDLGLFDDDEDGIKDKLDALIDGPAPVETPEESPETPTTPELLEGQILTSAWRSGEFSPGDAESVADVVSYEQDELGNSLGIDPEISAVLGDIPASKANWITPDEESAKRFGDSLVEVQFPKGAVVISDNDGDHGYLVVDLDGLDPEIASILAGKAPKTPEIAPETPENVEIPGDPADYTDAPENSTDDGKKAWEAFSDAVGAVYDIENPDVAKDIEDLLKHQDVKDSLSDLNAALSEWYNTASEDNPDFDTLNALIGEIQTHTGGLAEALEQADSGIEPKIEALSTSMEKFSNASDAWVAANSTDAPTDAPGVPDAVEAPTFDDFSSIYDDLEYLHHKLNEEGNNTAGQVGAIGNNIANIGKELDQGKIEHKEGADLLGNVQDEIEKVLDGDTLDESSTDDLAGALTDIEKIRSALISLDSLPDPDDPETPDTEVEGDAPEVEAEVPETPAVPEAWQNTPTVDSVVDGILESAPPREVITDAVPELDPPLADWEKDLLGWGSKEASNPAEAIDDIVQTGELYHSALETVSDGDYPDAPKAIAAGESDRVSKAIADITDAAEADGITDADPATLVPDAANQAIVDQLKDQGSPIAKVIAEHLQGKIDAGEPLTEDDYTAIKGFIDFVTPAEENSAEDKADLINVADALDPVNAPTDIDTPETPTVTEIPVSEPDSPTDLVGDFNAPDALETGDALKAWTDTLQQFLVKSGPATAQEPIAGKNWNQLSPAQVENLQKIIESLPSELGIPLESIFNEHQGGSTTDDALVQAISTTLLDLPWNSKARTQLKGAQAGIQTNNAPLVPILRPKPAAYAKGKSFSEEELALPTPDQVKGTINAVIAQSAAGADLKFIKGGDGSTDDQVKQAISNAEVELTKAIDHFNAGEVSDMVARMRLALNDYDNAIALRNTVHKNDKIVRRLRARRRALDETLAPFEARWPDPVNGGTYQKYQGNYDYNNGVSHTDVDGNDVYPGDQIERTHKTAKGQTAMVLGWRGDSLTGYQAHLWLDQEKKDRPQGVAQGQFRIAAVGPNNPLFNDPDFKGAKVGEEIFTEFDTEQKKKVANQTKKAAKAGVPRATAPAVSEPDEEPTPDDYTNDDGLTVDDYISDVIDESKTWSAENDLQFDPMYIKHKDAVNQYIAQQFDNDIDINDVVEDITSRPESFWIDGTDAGVDAVNALKLSGSTGIALSGFEKKAQSSEAPTEPDGGNSYFEGEIDGSKIVVTYYSDGTFGYTVSRPDGSVVTTANKQTAIDAIEGNSTDSSNLAGPDVVEKLNALPVGTKIDVNAEFADHHGIWTKNDQGWIHENGDGVITAHFDDPSVTSIHVIDPEGDVPDDVPGTDVDSDGVSTPQTQQVDENGNLFETMSNDIASTATVAMLDLMQGKINDHPDLTPGQKASLNGAVAKRKKELLSVPDPQTDEFTPTYDELTNEIQHAVAAEQIEHIAGVVQSQGTKGLGVKNYNLLMTAIDKKYKEFTNNSISDFLENQQTPSVKHPFTPLPAGETGAPGDKWVTVNGKPKWGRYGASGIAIVAEDENGTEKVLIGKRGDRDEWYLPGGAIDEKESAIQGATRELSEESNEGAQIAPTLTLVSENKNVVGKIQGTEDEEWAYTTIVAEAPSVTDVTVPEGADGKELGEYRWVDADELAQMDKNGILHPSMSNGVFSNLIGFTDGDVVPMDNASIAPDDLSLPVYDMTGWKKVGNSLGTQPATVMQDKEGNKYYVKTPHSPEHAQNEILAASFYEALGVKTTQSRLGVAPSGKEFLVTPWVDGDPKALEKAVQSKDHQFLSWVQEDFAIDAWLGNYDIVGPGYSNIGSDTNGNPVRIDNGGALLYRGMGSQKSWWGSTPTEWDDMRQGSSKSSSFTTAKRVFGGMSDEALNASAAKLLSISKTDIADIVNATSFNDATKKKLISDLIERRHNILDKFNMVNDSKNKDLADAAGWEEKKEAQSLQQASQPTYEVGQKIVAHDGKLAVIETLKPDGWAYVKFDGADQPVLTHIDDIAPESHAGAAAEGGAVHVFTKNGKDFDAGETVHYFDPVAGQWITGTLGETPVHESADGWQADITTDDGKVLVLNTWDIVDNETYEKIKNNVPSTTPETPATSLNNLPDNYAPVPDGGEIIMKKDDNPALGAMYLVKNPNGTHTVHYADGQKLGVGEDIDSLTSDSAWVPVGDSAPTASTSSTPDLGEGYPVPPAGAIPLYQWTQTGMKGNTIKGNIVVEHPNGELHIYKPDGTSMLAGSQDKGSFNATKEWVPFPSLIAPSSESKGPVVLPAGYAPTPADSTPLKLGQNKHLGDTYVIKHPDGKIFAYYQDGSTLDISDMDLTKFNEGAGFTDLTNIPSTPVDPNTPLSATGKPIAVGDAVQIVKGGHKGKPTKGIVQGFDKNGNVKLKMYTDDGYPAKMPGKNVQIKSLVKSGSLKHQNVNAVTPSNPTGGETTPAVPTPGIPQPKNPGLPTGITLSTPDKNNPLYDTPAPQPPTAPSAVSGKFVDDNWITRADAAYKAYNENKTPGSGTKNVQDSSYWNSYYAKAMAGDESGLTFLKDKGYFNSDPALYQDALDASVEGKKDAAKQIYDYQKLQADYQAKHKEWLAANGKAFYTPLDPTTVKGMSKNQAINWANKRFAGVYNKLTSNARSGLQTQKGSSGWQTAIRLITKTIGLRREDVAAVSTPHNMAVWDQVKEAADIAGPVGEAWKGIRTVTIDRFANASGVTLKDGADLTQIIGTIQKDHGGMEFTPGDLDSGGQMGYQSGSVIMNLTVPPEIKGAYTGIPGEFSHGGEHGFIAEPGLAMYIWNVTPGPSGFKWRVDASLIPREVLPYMNNFEGAPDSHPIVLPGQPLPDNYKPNALIEGEVVTE